MTDMNPGAGASPFERPHATRRSRALRVAVSVLLVGTSIAAAVALTRSMPDATATTEHNHAAPAGGSAVPVMLDADQARRIGVTYAAAMLAPMTTDIRSVGQVTWDETRTTAIAPKVDGWVERLYVNFTGQDVSQGEALLDIYSPMLVTAQEELLLAARLVRDVAGGTEEARRGASEMLASARRRLEYWDIPAAEIERIERSGQATRTITLRATSRGTVVEKSVLSGQRIMAGETLYRLADLRTVWVDGQVFEQDLSRVRRGQRATVEIEAYAGERWSGIVTYVYPLIDAATRTARVRVELTNPGQRLKPGMFATVHLVGSEPGRVLSVPRSAVLSTGQRSIVFVRLPDGMLAPRDVVPGRTTDDRVEILNGLQPGDTVVASATFLVDAESNLRSALGSMAGMPGMDTPSRGTAPPPDSPRPEPQAPGPHHMGAGTARTPPGRREE